MAAETFDNTHHPSGWQRGCLTVAAACVVVLLGTGALGVLGARQGMFNLPWFNTGIGAMRLVGYSTWNVNCLPYTGCDPTLHEAYVIWLVTPPITQDQSNSAHRIFWLRLR